MWIALGLAFGTLISEDAALLGAAGLARAGVLPPMGAGLAVAAGIWLGDVGLFLVGRLAYRWGPIARYIDRRWPPTELQALAARLERRAGWTIAVSRVLPGTRAPLYVAAGVFRLGLPVFLLSTGVSVMLWTAAILSGALWWP